MAVLAPPVRIVSENAPPFVQVPSNAPPFVVYAGDSPNIGFPITIVESGAPPITLFNEDGSIWSAVPPAAGGALLLVDETAGFATDFTHATDAERVAVKTAGAVVYSGLSFFTNASASTKWVFNAAGTLVNVAAGSLAVDYHPSTHAALGLLSEQAATNLLLNNTTLSTQSVTVTATAYTLSFLGTGTVTLSGVSTAGPLVGTGASNRVSLTFTPTAGSLTLTVSGTVSNAQLETGSVATSIIRTTGASATRATDQISIAPASINHSATAGSWWVDCDFLASTAAGRVVAYTTNSACPLINFPPSYFQLSDTASLWVTVAGSSLGPHKLASAWTAGDRAATADGLNAVTDAGATANLLNPGAMIDFGQQSGGGNPLTGYFRKIVYVPRRKTNAEIKTETT